MNYLHNNQQLFSDILNACSEDAGIIRPIIEKDYFVTLLLKKIVTKCPEVKFNDSGIGIILLKSKRTLSSSS